MILILRAEGGVAKLGTKPTQAITRPNGMHRIQQMDVVGPMCEGDGSPKPMTSQAITRPSVMHRIQQQIVGCCWRDVHECDGQSKALLAKLVMGGLLWGSEPWKQL